MKKLQIIKKENSLYKFKDEEEREYEIALEIHDFEEPNEGDYIYMHNELINPKYEGYSTFYAFGNLVNKYGKENISTDDIDVIRVIKNKEEILMKRLYG